MSAEDFLSSGLRHLHDGRALHTTGRIDAAAYLAGYAIECSLKKLLEVQRARSARPYGHDLKGMTAQALALAALLAPASRRYRIDEVPQLAEAMAYWSPNLRYGTTGDVTDADAAMMLNAASGVARIILVGVLLDGREGRVR